MSYYPRAAADAKYVDTAGDTLTGTLVLAGNPTNPLDAVPKQYADLISQGFSFKNAVRAVSTTNITLSGLQTIDGVALSANNRVLVAGQTAASANGIYAAASGAWTRTTDADSSGEIQDGTLVPVAGGTANADTLWLCTAIGADPWIPDTNTSTWAKFSPAGGSSGHIIQEEGTPLAARSKLNFVGSTVTATDDAANDRTLITITGSNVIVQPDPPSVTGLSEGTIWVDEDSDVAPEADIGHEIQDEGTLLPDRAGLDFVGSGVTAADDAANNRTVVTIPTGTAYAGPSIIVLSAGESIPSGTPYETVIIRTEE